MELQKNQPVKIIKKRCISCLKEIETDALRCPDDGSLLCPVKKDDLTGQTLAGTYEIEQKIGEGGYGRVYKAKHNRLDKTVAIKILHAEYVDQRDLVLRFEREAKAVSALSHPGIASVFDFGILDQGQPFFVMEYFAGSSLAEIIGERKLIPWQEALPIFIKAATALDYAHQNAILHRDIKPSNVIVDPKTQAVKLLDFGLAKVDEVSRLTKTGDTAGTPHYMSPEQCVGEQLDVRSDVYSFGCLMYEALTGHLPFSGQSALDIMHKHLYEKPQSFSTRNVPDCPPALEALVLKCLEKRSMDRCSSMAAVASHLAEASGSASEKIEEHRSAEPSSFQRIARPVGVVLLICLLFGIAAFVDSKQPKILSESTSPGTHQSADTAVHSIEFHNIKLMTEGVTPQFVKDIEKNLMMLPEEIRGLLGKRKTVITLVPKANTLWVNCSYDQQGTYLCQIELGEPQVDINHAVWTAVGLAVNFQPGSNGVSRFMHDSPEFHKAYEQDTSALDETATDEYAKYLQPGDSGLGQVFSEALAVAMNPQGEALNPQFVKRFPQSCALVKSKFEKVPDWPPLR